MDGNDPVSPLRNDLYCSICLEVFTSPLSLPCGHSFCQKCIHDHWDREVVTGPFSCPDCRERFRERPEPQKNVSLSKVVDNLRALERSRALGPTEREEGGAHSAAPSLCQRHHKELSFYCTTECRCICSQCLLKGCRQHDVQDIGERSQQGKKKLTSDLQTSDHQKKHTEEEIEKWKSKIENIKEYHEKLLSGMMTKFEQVRKTVDECQILVVESVTSEKNAALKCVEEHVLALQSHLMDLEKHRMEAETLLRMDGVAFLESLPQLVPVGAPLKSPNVQLYGHLQREVVNKILPEVTSLLQKLPNVLYPEKLIDKDTSETLSGIDVNDSVCIVGTSRTSLSEQKTSPNRTPRISTLRKQLYEDYRILKFDPETANKYLNVSHDNCKTTHKSWSRKNDMSDSPKRFETWQVLCMEGFSEGSHYWEVGISIFFAEIGVAYETIKRTKEYESTIGRNSSSWSLQLRSMHHSVWHNNIETKLQSPMFREIGVHLDLKVGSLTFYGIQDDGSLQHLHSFSCVFTEKVFPAFWIGEDTDVTIRCPKMMTERIT